MYILDSSRRERGWMRTRDSFAHAIEIRALLLSTNPTFPKALRTRRMIAEFHESSYGQVSACS